MVAVHTYFTLGDMGDEWCSCVDAWAMLEEKLEYGVHGKVSHTSHTIYTQTLTCIIRGLLPSTKLHPTEWSKWISKTQDSQRCYSATSNLTNSPEFGGAVYALWHDMQLAFHKGPTGVLVDNTDHDESAIGDAWSMLWKGGPNGLASVLTLLMWWGLNVDMGPWHELLAPQWKATVSNITSSLQKMAEGSVGGKKCVSTESSNT
ncbi:hypothetical protein L208DRAFT_1333231 [Tricholoma matsutake]|nr:hypothetical protein L208DRAFT_1333231 [Tricholoma matsutake 945]